LLRDGGILIATRFGDTDQVHQTVMFFRELFEAGATP
jgi:hypothetical protein